MHVRFDLVDTIDREKSGKYRFCISKIDPMNDKEYSRHSND